MNELDRRAVLRGAGTAGVLALAAPVLAACGGGTSGGAGGASTGTGGSSGGTGGTSSDPLTIAAASIPVAGGVIQDGVVVTQPESGTFKAFSATCTHQSCEVDRVENGTIICPCHNSEFSAADGSVIQGPAPSALPARTATLKGKDVVIT